MKTSSSHLETSQLIFSTNQLTGFYMKGRELDNKLFEALQRENNLDLDLSSNLELETSRSTRHSQGLIQDLNLGGDMYVSSCWRITNVKRYCRQIDLLCSVLGSV